MKQRLGVIGLGVMGKPMVRNLLRAGHRVVVHNRSRAAVDELVAHGAVDGGSPYGVGEAADITVLMLPDGPDVEQVIVGQDGLLDALKPGSIVIDMSSINPDVSRRMATLLASRGAHYLDAPVSGGETGAIEGTLVIMAGGDAAVFEGVRPLLLHLGKSAVRIGSVGAGQTTKLVNQILVALHLQAMGEALLLASRSGVDCGLVVEAIRGGLAGSKVLDAKASKLLDRDFQPGFRMKLHRKDLANAMAAAHALGLNLPNARATYEMLDAIVENGHADEDHVGLVQALEQLNGSFVGGGA